MVLEVVKEMWTENPKAKNGDEKIKPVAVTKIRLISKMFLRGDPQYDIAATRTFKSSLALYFMILVIVLVYVWLISCYFRITAIMI